MKQVIGIWLCAILIGILGVFYVNASISTIEFESPFVEPVGALTVNDVRGVGVEGYQGGEDNIGDNLQPAQVGSLDYSQHTNISL